MNEHRESSRWCRRKGTILRITFLMRKGGEDAGHSGGAGPTRICSSVVAGWQAELVGTGAWRWLDVEVRGRGRCLLTDAAFGSFIFLILSFPYRSHYQFSSPTVRISKFSHKRFFFFVFAAISAIWLFSPWIRNAVYCLGSSLRLVSNSPSIFSRRERAKANIWPAALP